MYMLFERLKIMVKRKYGFTLPEIITASASIAVIIVIALAVTIRQDEIKEKRIEKMSKSFYGSVNSAYNQILDYDANDGEIQSLKDQNGDNKIDGKDLRILFNKYMNGNDVDCSKLGVGIKVKNYAAKNIPDNVVFCSEHPDRVVAGYYLNTACNSTVDSKQVFTRKNVAAKKPDLSPIQVSSACGSIVYGIKGTKNVQLGENIFVIPFGKTGLK